LDAVAQVCIALGLHIWVMLSFAYTFF
jgi:hypothetical protein